MNTFFITQTLNYQGARKTTSPVRDNLCNVQTFKTREEAQDWIDSMEASAYQASHNASDCPTYQIQQLK